MLQGSHSDLEKMELFNAILFQLRIRVRKVKEKKLLYFTYHTHTYTLSEFF